MFLRQKLSQEEFYLVQHLFQHYQEIPLQAGQLKMLAQDQMKQPLIHQVQRNTKVKGMQQELVRAHLLQQSYVHLWKMLQLKLRIQLCQNLLILPSQAEKKDQSWKEVQEVQKLQGEHYIRHFFAGQVKAEETFPHEDEILEWF